MRFFGFRTPGSTDLADAIFVPLTGATESYNAGKVRFTMWLDGVDVLAAPGIQYSNDGLHWGYAPGVVATMIEQDGPDWVPVDWITPYDTSPADPRVPTEDRFVQTEWVDTPEGFSGLDGTPRDNNRNFFRTGAFILDAGSTSYTKGGRIAMVVEVKGLEASTQTSELVLCFTGGGDGTTPDPVSVPITGAIAGQDVTKIRFTLELTSRDRATVSLRWQGSLDGNVWDATENTISGSPTASDDGYVFPTEFLDIDVSDWRYFRILARVVNTTSSDTKVRSVIVRLKVDTREC